MINTAYIAEPVETIRNDKQQKAFTAEEKSELRRLMYQRIAQGHQLTETEETAHERRTGHKR